jgi:hypothetical protein
MKINKFKLAVIGIGSLAGVTVTVVAVQMRKYGGHITVGIGDRELAWIIDGKKAIEEVGEGA